MQIDRDFDGSYGTAAVNYDNEYLLVFDEINLSYESGVTLGLIEESTSLGWSPRYFFVANSGLMPSQFSVLYTGA